jgi:integrase
MLPSTGSIAGGTMGLQFRADGKSLAGLTAGQADELWEALYRTSPEIERLLAYFEANALHPWIQPLLATTVHTGARKGALLRMRVSDVDFVAGHVVIREKKRVHGRRTTGRVPPTTALAAILSEWLEAHPGGSYRFAQAEQVERSIIRSRTTGHLRKDRPGGFTLLIRCSASRCARTTGRAY